MNQTESKPIILSGRLLKALASFTDKDSYARDAYKHIWLDNSPHGYARLWATDGHQLITVTFRGSVGPSGDSSSYALELEPIKRLKVSDKIKLTIEPYKAEFEPQSFGQPMMEIYPRSRRAQEFGKLVPPPIDQCIPARNFVQAKCEQLACFDAGKLTKMFKAISDICKGEESSSCQWQAGETHMSAMAAFKTCEQFELCAVLMPINPSLSNYVDDVEYSMVA